VHRSAGWGTASLRSRRERGEETLLIDSLLVCVSPQSVVGMEARI
jgi:hypothetical protein